MATQENTQDENTQSTSGAEGDGSESNPFLATAAADTFAGSEGADWVSYASSTRGISVNLDTDPATVYGGWATGDRLTGINNLIGSAYNDNLLGNSAANILRGGAGRDYLVGGAGADTLDGGQGEADAALYHLASDGVRVDLSNGGAQQDFDGTHGFASNGNDAVGDILTDIEDLWGSTHADWFTGDDGDNRIYGNAGNDRLEGGAGNDILSGGEGADSYVFEANFGLDTIQGDADGGNLYFRGATALDDFIFERTDDGDVVVSVGSDSVTILSSAYADGRYTLYYGVDDLPLGELRAAASEDETTRGTDGNDLLVGTGGADILYGLAGDDHIDGRAGDDTLYGNEGKDTLYGSEGDDILYGGAGNDILYGDGGGDGGFDTVNNPASNQARDDGIRGYNAFVSGTPGNNTIHGGAGDDTLIGGMGDDTLLGGAGADTYIFESGHGTDTVTDDGGRIIFFQNAGNDDYDDATYAFTRADGGRGAAVTLTVANGGNILNVIEFTTYPSAGYDFYTRIGGTNTNTLITTLPAVPLRQDGSEHYPFLATAAADSFMGYAGADWVSYEDFPSTSWLGIFTGLGVFVTLTDNHFVSFTGWAKGDTLPGINNLIGSNSHDNLRGNEGANILRGGGGGDNLYGFDGNDRLEGGAGRDTLYGGAGADILDGGSGEQDKADYSSPFRGGRLGVRVDLSNTGKQIDFDGSHGFVANNNHAVGDILSNIEDLEGSNKDDWLTGDGNANDIDGGGGNDRIEGRAGNDRLWGGRGADTLYGGSGNDYLLSSSGDDNLYGGLGDDYLYGFSDNDRLDGGAGTDTYFFAEYGIGNGIDTIHDVVGDTMILRFSNYFDLLHTAADFTRDSNNFHRVGNNLEIITDIYPNDGRIDKVTIQGAYDNDPNTGTGNAAFTIHINLLISEIGNIFSPSIQAVTDEFWHYL